VEPLRPIFQFPEPPLYFVSIFEGLMEVSYSKLFPVSPMPICTKALYQRLRSVYSSPEITGLTVNLQDSLVYCY
jgi:hypothetical protein